MHFGSWRRWWFDIGACASPRGLCWLKQPSQLWIIHPQTLIKQQMASPAASGDSWTSLALHTHCHPYPSLQEEGHEGTREEMQGTRCVLPSPWPDCSRVPLSQELALPLPLLSSVYGFCKGSCLPQKMWLILGPPVVPKGHRFFCFLSPFLQGQT